MAEHRFTDETATIVVLGELTKDMRHVLSRIAAGLALVAVFTAMSALIDLARGDWFTAGVSGGAFLWWCFLTYETSKRHRKYARPTR